MCQAPLGHFAAARGNRWWHGCGGGEDLDFTIRLRLAGYKIVFAPCAICYTDVPETLFALRQRSRWERDCYWIRFRKYRRLFNPFATNFVWRETAHQWDFPALHGFADPRFSFYVGWLFGTFGVAGAATLLLAVSTLFVGSGPGLFRSPPRSSPGGRSTYGLLPFLPIDGFVRLMS